MLMCFRPYVTVSAMRRFYFYQTTWSLACFKKKETDQKEHYLAIKNNWLKLQQTKAFGLMDGWTESLYEYRFRVASQK